jgi:hypothetical protein
VWNLFKVLGKKRELIQNVYKTIEKALAKLDAQKKRQLLDANSLIQLGQGLKRPEREADYSLSSRSRLCQNVCKSTPLYAFMA